LLINPYITHLGGWARFRCSGNFVTRTNRRNQVNECYRLGYNSYQGRSQKRNRFVQWCLLFRGRCKIERHKWTSSRVSLFFIGRSEH
jgi:hypothetical protein